MLQASCSGLHSPYPLSNDAAVILVRNLLVSLYDCVFVVRGSCVVCRATTNEQRITVDNPWHFNVIKREIISPFQGFVAGDSWFVARDSSDDKR